MCEMMINHVHNQVVQMREGRHCQQNQDTSSTRACRQTQQCTIQKHGVRGSQATIGNISSPHEREMQSVWCSAERGPVIGKNTKNNNNKQTDIQLMTS